MKITKAYTYDDVCLVPKHSTVSTRSSVDTSVSLSDEVKLKIPILTSNMLHVTGDHMIDAITNLGGMAVMHRFYEEPASQKIVCSNRLAAYRDAICLYPYLDVGKQEYTISRLTYEKCKLIAPSFGVTDHEKNCFDIFSDYMSEYLKVVCIDVAHGHHSNVEFMAKVIKLKLPNVLLIAGNVATAEGACFLADAGVDVIKAGVGPGSLCSTRVQTGNGIPQLTALENVREGLDKSGFANVKIVADGGIRNSGDIVKSLCFADAVMLGNAIAGTPEAPGDVIEIQGKRYKKYAGSSTHKARNVEGVSALVPVKPSVGIIVDQLMQGLRSGMSYQGVVNLMDLKKDPEFVELSNAGIIESKPHDVIL